MKKIDLGQTVSILANIGVIAGIIFLGYELRQNNENMQAQTTFNQHTVRTAGWRTVIENPNGLVEVWVKLRNGEEVSEADRIRMQFFGQYGLRDFEWQYAEMVAGRLSEGSLDPVGWRAVFHSVPMMTEHFEATKNQMDSGFVRFVEESVLAGE